MQKRTDVNIELKSQFTGSRKVYVEGSRPDIKVPMREIGLSRTVNSFGEEEKGKSLKL